MKVQPKVTEKQDLEVLIRRLDSIDRQMKRQARYRYIIPRAIINGVFVTFGATIVFAIVIVILAKAIKASDQIPILNDIIERTKLEEIINNQNK